METPEEKINKKHVKEAQDLHDGLKALSKTADAAIENVFNTAKSLFENKEDFLKAKDLTERLVDAGIKGDKKAVESLKKDLMKLEESTNSDNTK